MQNADDFSAAELDNQYVAELPGRQLMVSLSLLGIPLLGLDGVTINLDTAGPNWLFGAVGDV